MKKQLLLAAALFVGCQNPTDSIDEKTDSMQETTILVTVDQKCAVFVDGSDQLTTLFDPFGPEFSHFYDDTAYYTNAPTDPDTVALIVDYTTSFTGAFQGGHSTPLFSSDYLLKTSDSQVNIEVIESDLSIIISQNEENEKFILKKDSTLVLRDTIFETSGNPAQEIKRCFEITICNKGSRNLYQEK